MAGSGPLAALAERDFRRYWIGQTISLTGAWMQQVAQGWVIIGLTGSTTAIASVSAATALPQVSLLLQGGVVADRRDRRRLLVVTQIGLAAVAFAFAALVGSGHLRLGWVYLLSLLLGTVLAFDLPAAQALVPQLVAPAALPSAVALNQATFHGSRLIGPALAGLLIARTSPAMAFLANGLSYFAVVLSLLVIRPRPAASPGPPVGTGALAEGLAFVRGSRVVSALIGFTALGAAFIFPFLVVFMPVLVQRLYGGDEQALGLVMSSSGLGALSGSLAVLRVPAPLRGRAMLAGALAAGAALAGMSLAHTPRAAALILAGLSLSVSFGLGLNATVLQLLTPDRLRGRVMSIQTLAFAALTPGSALLLGALGERLDLRWLLRLAAAAYALLAVPWLVRAGLHHRTDLRPAAAPGGIR